MRVELGGVLWVSPGLRGSVVEKMVRHALLNVRRERSVGRTYTAELECAHRSLNCGSTESGCCGC